MLLFRLFFSVKERRASCHDKVTLTLQETCLKKQNIAILLFFCNGWNHENILKGWYFDPFLCTGITFASLTSTTNLVGGRTKKSYGPTPQSGIDPGCWYENRNLKGKKKWNSFFIFEKKEMYVPWKDALLSISKKIWR
jgi:hypothetical protein